MGNVSPLAFLPPKIVEQLAVASWLLAGTIGVGNPDTCNHIELIYQLRLGYGMH